MGGVVNSIMKPVNSILGGVTGANQANRALDTAMGDTRASKDEASRIMGQQYGMAQQYQSPFAQTAYTALPMLQSAIYGTPQHGYTVDPMTGIPKQSGQMVSFQGQPMSYTGQQQAKMVANQMAGRGLLGRQTNAMGQVQAQDAENQINRLMSLLGIGQSGVNNLTSAATTYGSQMGNLATGTANNMASLYGQQGQLATASSPFSMATDVLGALGGAKKAVLF